MRYGYVIGLIYFGATFWWIYNVTAVGMVFLVLYLALYPAWWFLFVARLLPRQGKASSGSAVASAFGAAALWVMLEWWRSWFLTGFNWNELGITQSSSLVYRQLAAFGGVHLLSFLLVAVNVLWAEGLLGIVETVREKRVVRASAPFAIALLLAASGFALGWHHLQRHNGESRGPSATFACVQPDIPQIPYDPNQSHRAYEMTEADALDKLEKLTLNAITLAPVKPDLLIWPEAMISQGVFQDQPLTEAVTGDKRSLRRVLPARFAELRIRAERPASEPTSTTQPFFFSPHGDEYAEYPQDVHLVMLGEFLPFGDTFLEFRKWTWA